MSNLNMNDETTTSSSDEYQESGTVPSFLLSHYTVLAVTTIAVIAVLVVLSFWLREFCYDQFGIEFCSGSISTARRREIRRFRLRALQLQRRMERDLLESSVEKQEERRERYRALLHKFTKTLTEEDIIEEEAEEDMDLEPQRYLRIFPHDPSKKEHVVEAICIICFKDYEAGEQVVWSPNNTEACRHVYHRECILKWISTGKNKCPVCRNVFVPNFMDHSSSERNFPSGNSLVLQQGGGSRDDSHSPALPETIETHTSV